MRLDDLVAGDPVAPLTPERVARLRSILFDKYQADAVLVGPMPGERDAVALFTELIERHPDRIEVRLLYASCLVNSEVRLAHAGDAKRVLQDSSWTRDMTRFQVEKVLDQAPRDSEQSTSARLLLGEALYRSGEWDQARAVFEQIIADYSDRGVNLAPTWDTIGHCQYRKGDYKQAVEAFRKACDITPTRSTGFLSGRRTTTARRLRI